MRSSVSKTGPLLWILSVALTFALSACGGSSAKATPTLSVEAIFTSAAQTFSAQQATELALTPPTDTPAPSDTPSPSPTPGIGDTPAGTGFPTLSLGSSFPTLAFGAPTLAAGGTNCDNSTFVSDVTIPDGTRLQQGEKFVKTWLLQNNGTCPWTPTYKLQFVDGTKMSGAAASVNIAVPVGQQAKISVNMIAPIDVGSFYGRWQLQNDAGKSFGSIVTVVIKVGAAQATSTATP